MEAMIIVGTITQKQMKQTNSSKYVVDPFPRSIFESLQAQESTTQLCHLGSGLGVLDLARCFCRVCWLWCVKTVWTTSASWARKRKRFSCTTLEMATPPNEWHHYSSRIQSKYVSLLLLLHCKICKPITGECLIQCKLWTLHPQTTGTVS
jgi:hypothetical protein